MLCRPDRNTPWACALAQEGLQSGDIIIHLKKHNLYTRTTKNVHFTSFFEHNTTTNPQLFLLLMYYTYTILFGYKISIHLFASNSTTTIRTKQTLCLTTWAPRQQIVQTITEYSIITIFDAPSTTIFDCTHWWWFH